MSATLEAGTNQPVLLYFTASWCPPCKLMGQTTLKDPSVESNLLNFARVALDVDEFPGSARDYHASAIPAFLILTSEGNTLLRTEGYRDPVQFLTWLEQAQSIFRAAQAEEVAFEKKQKAIAASLKSSDAATRNKALSELFDLCADHAPSRHEYAFSQLKPLAASEPKYLLPGLAHPSLATRIAVANLLRDALGEKFQFDPWAQPEERARAITDLEKVLKVVKPAGPSEASSL